LIALVQAAMTWNGVAAAFLNAPSQFRRPAMRHRKRATTAAGFEQHFAKALLIVPAPAWRQKALTPSSYVYG
jgi:hypothetical protein